MAKQEAGVAESEVSASELLECGHLLVLSLPHVQRFIAESRRASDLLAGSIIFSMFAWEAIEAIRGENPSARLIMPAVGRGQPLDGSVGISNRLALLLPQHLSIADAKTLAESAVAAVGARWGMLLRDTFPEPVPPTPGFPEIIWVISDAHDADAYAAAWNKATNALTYRKRVRTFTAHTETGQVCSLTGRWAAVTPPDRLLRRRPGEQLSAACWVKREYARSFTRPFPSTSTLATSRFRFAVCGRLGSGDQTQTDLAPAIAAVAAAVRGLARAVRRRGARIERPSAYRSLPYRQWRLGSSSHRLDRLVSYFLSIDGSWMYPETWESRSALQELGADLKRVDHHLLENECKRGRAAVQDLLEAAREEGISPPATYLALIAQDADDMGKKLSLGRPSAKWHSQVSVILHRCAKDQADLIESEIGGGRNIYAGGDDLLALVPVHKALSAAVKVRKMFADAVKDVFPKPPTASTAIVFFHYAYPLQEAVRCVQRALKEAKAIRTRKDCLALVVLRRGGERTRAYVDWQYPGRKLLPADLDPLVEALGVNGGPRSLSPGLIGDLEKESIGLEHLREDERRSEILRLLRRHWSGADAKRDQLGESLVCLMNGSSVPAKLLSEPQGQHARRLAALLQIAMFVSSEGR